MPRSPLPLLLPVTLLLGACNLTDASTATPVWQDEFSGTGLDTSKWSYQTGNGFTAGTDYVAGWGNNELEYYTDRSSNVSVQGGTLVITARREKITGPAGRTAGTFDVSATLGGTKGTPTNWAGTMYFRVTGDNNAKIKGLQAWIPQTAPTSTAFFGVEIGRAHV